MNARPAIYERRTSTDEVFDGLHDDIVSLRMPPGTRISETEVAARFGVSRQPVRNAFSRLGAMGLLLVRPQKATEVQKFSLDAIASARFIRAAVEVEVVALAARIWDDSHRAAFTDNLDAQARAAKAGDIDGFHDLDFDFHRLICMAAGIAPAFETIRVNKVQIDRLCVLSMTDGPTLGILVEDHREIFGALSRRDPDAAVARMRAHLDRLSATIEDVHRAHPQFFD